MNNIYIIAGTFGQFRQFRNKLCSVMAEEGMSFRQSDFIYIDRPDRLKGIENPWGYKVGEWFKRDDIESIIEAIRISRSDPDVDFIPVEL